MSVDAEGPSLVDWGLCFGCCLVGRLVWFGAISRPGDLHLRQSVGFSPRQPARWVVGVLWGSCSHTPCPHMPYAMECDISAQEAASWSGPTPVRSLLLGKGDTLLSEAAWPPESLLLPEVEKTPDHTLPFGRFDDTKDEFDVDDDMSVQVAPGKPPISRRQQQHHRP